MTLDKRFYSLFFKQEAVAALLLPHFFPYAFLDEAFISILGINYIIKIGISDNNAAINNYYGWLQDLTLLFKIPMSTRKDYFKFIDNLGTRPQKRFASDVLSKTCSSAVLSVTNLIWTAWDRTRDTFKKQRSFGNRGYQTEECFHAVLTRLQNVIIHFVQLSEITENVRSNAITNV